MTRQNSVTSFRYSRKDRKEVLVKYPEAEYIVILKGPQKFWVYDEDARIIATLFNAPLFRTKKGFALTIDPQSVGEIAAELEARESPYILVFPETELVCSGPFIMPESEITVGVGKRFSVKNGEGEESSVLITAQMPVELVQVSRLGRDSTTELIPKPILSDGKSRLISIRTPLARALIGKRVGDCVDVCGDTYTIMGIE